MGSRVPVEFGVGNAFWPAPVALISVGVNNPNFFTLGVMGAPCNNPPILTISPKPYRYSYELLHRHGEFVVNFPTVDMIRQVEYAGMYSGRDVNKWDKCGLTPTKGHTVSVPLIAECPVSIECRVLHEIRFRRSKEKLGTHVLVVAEMLQLSAYEDYVIDGQLCWDLLDLIFRSRPASWRALGPVMGYDIRKTPPGDPRLAAERIEERVEGLQDEVLAFEREPPPLPSEEPAPPRVD